LPDGSCKEQQLLHRASEQHLMLKRSTHFTVGMLNAKTGSHTGSYSGLYVPEPKERHVLSE